MAKHRTHSIEFKRQVVQDYLGGETLYRLAKRHEISRTLIRVWLAKHEAGVLDSDTAAAPPAFAGAGSHRDCDRLRLPCCDPGSY